MDTKGDVAQQYGARGTPAHFFIDKKGNIAGGAIGYKNFSSSEVKKLIEYLIEDKKS